MINITIEEAYVPYDIDCMPHGITVYNGHDNTSKLIDYFCGKISHVSVYTTNNSALLGFKFTTSILVYQTFIIARYISHVKGTAYKVIGPCLPSDITAPSKLTAFLYENRVHYVWYIANEVNYDKSKDMSKLFMVNWLVQIHKFVCECESAEILVYPGLLPFRWFMWMAKPFHAVECNITKEHIIKIDFHMYITVQLNVMPTVKMLINMTFPSITKYMKIYNGNQISNYTDIGSSFLHIKQLSKIESFTIQHFTYNGHTATIQQGLIHKWDDTLKKDITDHWIDENWNSHDIGIFILFSFYSVLFFVYKMIRTSKLMHIKQLYLQWYIHSIHSM